MPYFSVILPTYNRAHLLPKAIQSVLAQTFHDWELIIVDDGSRDNTKDIVENHIDSRIQYIYQENQERSAARNNGINHAKGEYICFLDSDDYFQMKKLESLQSFIEKQSEKHAIYYDGISFQLGSKISTVDLPVKKSDENIFEFLLINPLFSQQICGHNSIFNKFKYDTRFRIGEDIELWIRIAQKYNFVPIFNSVNTVIVEHDARTINLKNGNSSLEHLKLLRYLFSADKNSDKFSRRVRLKAVSNCSFNMAKYFMFMRMKMKAIKWLMKSLIANPSHEQSKHKIYCLKMLCFGKIPKEYKTQK